MNQPEFIGICQSLFEKNNLSCSEEQATLLHQLTDRMLEVNRSMNLTAITDESAIILRHYVDSVMISASIPEGASVIDVGCGAGFPTLPLAIFRPDLKITALDGTAKRIRYVEETASLLGLKNVIAIAGRAEEYGNNPKYREQFAIATARAVANLQVLCELCLPFVKQNGRMISMKAQKAAEELSAARNCITLCGGVVENIARQDLIGAEQTEERNLISIRKIKITPEKYPRHFSKISKNPL